MIKSSISLTNGVKTVGPYSAAIKIGNLVVLSGQLGIAGETNQLVSGGVVAQTKQIFENIENILARLNLTYNHIIKTTVFLAEMADFPEFNAVYETFFNYPFPARSTIAVKGLPLNALVEIECWAVDSRAVEAELKEAAFEAEPSRD